MILALAILGIAAAFTLLVLLLNGALRDMERLHDEDDGEWL